MYKSMVIPPDMKPTSDTLAGAGGEITCYGKFQTTTRSKDREYVIDVYVIDGSNLLGRTDASALGFSKFNRDPRAIAELTIDSDVFGDTGLMKTSPLNIKICEGATPYHVNVARRMPIPLLPKVEDELRRMERAGIIKKITEPTPWCAPMVAAPKKPDKVRICIDLKQLNKVVQRERYIIPAISQVLAKLTGSVCFTKLDASGGYWQLELDEESSKLTTFITPLGHFCMMRVPFGISSASNIFQRKMEELEGLRGVKCYQDDIIVHGRMVEEHNSILQTVLQRIKESGLKFNQQKCLFSQSELEFLGHKIGREGTSPHPNKVRPIVDLEQPSNVSELRSVMGMVNHLGQYLPHLSTVTKPLNDLLKTDSVWNWGYEQQEAFTKIKIMVTSAPALAYFDPNKPTTVSADASSYGIGGVLLQESDGKQHPVAFCSRTLTPTEQQYAQIERECLACVWSCDKFMQYLRGPHFVSFDHGSQTIGTTNRRKGLEYGEYDAHDVVQS